MRRLRSELRPVFGSGPLITRLFAVMSDGTSRGTSPPPLPNDLYPLRLPGRAQERAHRGPQSASMSAIGAPAQAPRRGSRWLWPCRRRVDAALALLLIFRTLSGLFAGTSPAVPWEPILGRNPSLGPSLSRAQYCPSGLLFSFEFMRVHSWPKLFSGFTVSSDTWHGS
jgi:hypothetical protein